MALIQSYETPQGVAGVYHKVISIDYDCVGEAATFTVAVFSNAESRQAGKGALWHERVTVPFSALPADPREVAYGFLTTSTTSYLNGAAQDPDDGAPEGPLQLLKDEKWAQIKLARDAQEFGGFDTPYGRFDSDQKSVSNIMGAALAAQVQGPSFSIAFTLADNTAVTLNQAQMVEVGMLLAQHKSAVYEHGRQLRAQIEAATTAQQVEAITWEA